MSENRRSSTPDPDSDQGVREGQVDNINKRAKGGTSAEDLSQRVERGGHHRLLEAVREGRISTFAAAVEAGIVRRRKTAIVDGDEPNVKRRAHSRWTPCWGEDRSSAPRFRASVART